MKVSQLKTIIQETVKDAVKEAVREELIDVLLERSQATSQPLPFNPPQQVVETQQRTPPSPQMSSDLRSQYASMIGGGNPITTNSIPNQPLQVQPGMNTAGEGSALPAGDVSMDQIMGLMNK